jgi:hypothetical protein
MAAGTARYVQHTPPRLERQGAANERHGALSVGVIPVGIEEEIVLAEPFLEPLSHEKP